MNKYITTIIFFMFLVSCSHNTDQFEVDGVLNSNNSNVLSTYGLGKIVLKDCTPQLMRVGEFPLSIIYFVSKQDISGQIEIELMNKIPYQIIRISFNLQTLTEIHTNDPRENEDYKQFSTCVDIKKGINVIVISYLNSDKTPLSNNYLLGNERVDFIKYSIHSSKI